MFTFSSGIVFERYEVGETGIECYYFNTISSQWTGYCEHDNEHLCCTWEHFIPYFQWGMYFFFQNI